MQVTLCQPVLLRHVTIGRLLRLAGHPPRFVRTAALGRSRRVMQGAYFVEKLFLD
ncbi:hypothetical protein R1T40_09810 [Tritonibacter scottomollicae]|uniref:Uncharacterized protein n=1 Tax=Tritonibacter scottomollicae TaxID=483013 RepID=A0ABZ0HLF6_TRISK|nr:hypothetical protein R1T40_09810 [Tritonibacter scottomollicae]